MCRLMFKMILLLLLVVLVKGEQNPLGMESCSTVCNCQNELEVTCRGAGEDKMVDTVPNDLSPWIKKLVLKGNKIKIIGNMESYSSLEVLDISHNFLVDILPRCFQASQQLTVLDMSHNRLGTLNKEDMEGLVRLTHLDISHNSLDQINSDTFSHQSDLQSLHLGHNRLSSLDRNIFFGLVRKKLRDLDLSSNLLQRVPREALAGLVDLTSLDLSGNQLGILENMDFEGIGSQLQNLKLSGCLLHSIGPTAFQGLTSLKHLDISNNGLSLPPNKAFSNLRLLEDLRIGRNKIAKFGSDDFLSLKQLKHIHMEGCDVDQFTLERKVFAGNTNLETITITKCQGFTKIEPEISLTHLSVLRKVIFHSCSLTNVPEMLLNWADLEMIDLTGNNLLCDCELLFLSEAKLQRPGLQLSGHCDTPDQLHGQDLIRVRQKDFVCDVSKSVSRATIGVLVTVSVLSIIAIALGAVLWIRRYKVDWTFWRLGQRREKKKKLSASFSGSKKDIQVVQNKIDDDEGTGFVQLPGLDNVEHLYAEVTETVPNYGIPLVRGNFPDVKISVI